MSRWRALRGWRDSVAPSKSVWQRRADAAWIKPSRPLKELSTAWRRLRSTRSRSGRSSANVEHEREVAIFDILDGNAFSVDGMDAGPYKLHLAIAEERLLLAITAVAASDEMVEHTVPLTPLKRIVKDYFMICEFL